MGILASVTRRLLPGLLLVAVAGCPPPPPKKAGDRTTVTVDGDPPDFPDGFDPGKPLPDPAPPDPGQFGLAYLEQLYPAFRDGWSAFLEDARLRLAPTDPLNSPTLETSLELTIDAHGALVELTRLTSSGSGDFDATAQEIVEEAAPFPAPARDLLSDDGQVHVTWRFARDRRQAGVATAELRRIEWPLERSVPKLLGDGDIAEAARRLERAVGAVPAGTDPGSAEVRQLLDLSARVMVTALRAGLLVEDPAVQAFGIEAVTAAARAGDASAVAAAAHELRSIASGSVEIGNRAAAISALAALDDKDAVGLITGILDKDLGGNAALSGAAAAALVALGHADDAAATVGGWLASGDRAKVGGALGSLVYAAVPGTAAAVARQIGDKDVNVRVFACRALGRQAETAADAPAAWKGLRKGLDDREATVRAACAAAASVAADAGRRNRTAYWRLVELLKDRDERVRAAAVAAAIRLDPAKSGEELAVIARDKSPVVLAALAEGLGYAAGATPKKLIALAGHADVHVRVAAVRALARRDAAARKLAAALVVDPEQSVRIAAVAATDDLAALDSLVADADPLIAAAAQARAIVLRGRWASLAATLATVIAAPADGALRVDVAAAWLRAG